MSQYVTITMDNGIADVRLKRPGGGLGSTTGWIHRTVLKHKQVQRIAEASCVKIDDAGLHIMADGRPEVLDVDNEIVCAGQHPQRTLQQQLQQRSLTPHLIGGADQAMEFDAKRAINLSARLAAAIGSSNNPFLPDWPDAAAYQSPLRFASILDETCRLSLRF
ncbi:hypothetical protein ACHMW6_24670 [Pseudoduganella sp. UC29_106]|uniref:hypothetical protein n=1 Tax=Pseudoduganella sp. UC29_106 TaxID=3374553 RepID=UPI00375666B3